MFHSVTPSISNSRKLFIYFAALICSVCYSANLFAGEWEEYVDSKIGRPFYYLYTETLTVYFPHAKHLRALDLGSGSGNEVIDLLRKDWRVTATDILPYSRDVILARAHLYKNKSLEFQLSDFSELHLSGQYDWIMSFSSLPFGKKKDLAPLLKKISAHMKKGAVFSANFFGITHDFVKNGDTYGVTKEEIEKLLAANQLYITFYLHRNYIEKDSTQQNIHWDMHDIIAVKG